MEVYLFTHALREFLRFKRIVAWVLVCAGIAVIGILWPHITSGESATQQYADLSSMLVFHVVALASAIMTTSIIGQEVEQKTIVYILTRPVSRWKLLLARFLASVVAVSLVAIVGALLLSAVIFKNPLDNELLPKDILAIVLGAFAYGGLFLFVSLLVMRSMSVCVLYAFAWETSVPNLPGELYRLSIFSYMQGVAEHPNVAATKGAAFLAGEMGNNLLTADSSIPMLIILGAVFLTVALFWFTRFEYVPREDAE